MHSQIGVEDSHVDLLHEIGVRLASADGFHEVLDRVVVASKQQSRRNPPLGESRGRLTMNDAVPAVQQEKRMRPIGQGYFAFGACRRSFACADQCACMRLKAVSAHLAAHDCKKPARCENIIDCPHPVEVIRINPDACFA